MMKFQLPLNSRFATGFVLASLLFGSAAFAIDGINNPQSGYLLCVDKKTKDVTFPGNSKCPKGSEKLILGAQGAAGIRGDKGDKGDKGDPGAAGPKGDAGSTGPAGTNGNPGVNGLPGVKGSSLLTGIGAPANSLGENGDTYIDKNGALIYGPKTSGLWGNPTAFGGPAGGPGPKGEPGATGAAGPSGAALVLDLPTNFHQKFRINSTASGCCWPGNSNLKIVVSFKNITNSAWTGNDTGQLWLHFFDENGTMLYGSNQSEAFSPGSQSIATTWPGNTWAAGADYEWLITLNDMYANKPANAAFVSIVFRFQNLSGLSWFLDGDRILTNQFVASPFNSSN